MSSPNNQVVPADGARNSGFQADGQLREGMALGTVVRGDARVMHVILDGEDGTQRAGETRQFAPRGRLFEECPKQVKSPLAVGDRVIVGMEGDPPPVEYVLPRRNYLSRVASSHDPREQILFANVDQLLIVASITKPLFSSNRTDRILAACAYHEIPATLVLNKLDLDRKGDREALVETYRSAGYPVLETTATEGQGAEAFGELLRDKVSVLYGPSGAGKSTLVNAVQPGLNLRVGKISSYWDQGRHTTSYSQMHYLETVNGWVIDTPGIRVFRLHSINKAELRDQYPEFRPYIGKCRFQDCSHDHEPDCAVFDAVEAGKIAPTRFASYVEILDELEPPPEDIETVLPPPGD
ncbi:MAG: ribosome biogenesis GTPase [Planctomycetota bacterium]|jgi:ribosome biogenesis GTPase